MKIDVKALLRLSAVPGVGAHRIRSLVSAFRSPEEAFRASISALTAVDGIDVKTARNIKTFKDDGFAAQQLSLMNKCEAKIITFWDSAYPARLKNIADPPAFIFMRGDILKSDEDAIAVVGMRQPSEYGKITAEKLCSDLAHEKITVVSGLARGIDTHGHTAALNAGGRTLAVLGSGVDVIYPFENKSLAQRIISRGALISEFPMGTGPDAPNFPRRNRIISGLSAGTVVIEAGERSGALITASVALEQNREVFAVPGSVHSPKSKGTNRLIQEGAKLVTCVQDVVDEVRPQLTHIMQKARIQRPLETLTDLERKMFESLSHEPQHIDAIAQTHGIPTSQALTLLLSLELKYMAKQIAGKMFVRI